MVSTGQTTSLQFNANAAPAAVLLDTVSTQIGTGLNSFTPRTANLILDITYDVAPTRNFSLFTRRSTDERKLLIPSARALPTFTGDNRAGYPIGLKGGFFQIVEQQSLIGAGLAASQAFTITLQRPLDV